jgi:hypothetical protein
VTDPSPCFFLTGVVMMRSTSRISSYLRRTLATWSHFNTCQTKSKKYRQRSERHSHPHDKHHRCCHHDNDQTDHHEHRIILIIIMTNGGIHRECFRHHDHAQSVSSPRSHPHSVKPSADTA